MVGLVVERHRHEPGDTNDFLAQRGASEPVPGLVMTLVSQLMAPSGAA